MATFFKFIKTIFYPDKKQAKGPNTLNELLVQFDQPKKEKTQEDIIRDYQVKITMLNLEYDMLKLDPSLEYKGSYRWVDSDKNVYFDWVPCIIRPEVLYCSYYKN
jgi:hypothetical protein